MGAGRPALSLPAFLSATRRRLSACRNSSSVSFSSASPDTARRLLAQGSLTCDPSLACLVGACPRSGWLPSAFLSTAPPIAPPASAPSVSTTVSPFPPCVNVVCRKRGICDLPSSGTRATPILPLSVAATLDGRPGFVPPALTVLPSDSAYPPAQLFPSCHVATWLLRLVTGCL
ncbi:hypothetical protein C8R45DRAFT_1112756 [Mycena sanguinolenta]|nr:hypothetical protein C8R45DRAFT_1112756 [Mycena sanguinolenta]